MKIVIIGDGKVGYKLAQELSAENYDIVMIDSNEKKLREAIDKLDIICVTGDGGSVEVQKEADVPHAELVIVCTSMDECNMLDCLIARSLGAKHTIARVRNPIYYRQIDLLKEDLHLSMAVNPELAVAGEIGRLLVFPDASKIETFVKGRVNLVEFPVTQDSRLVGMSLLEIYSKFQIKMLVCAVKSGDKVMIPGGDYVIRGGDRLHIAVSQANTEVFFKLLKRKKNKVRKVVICGGGRVSYYLGRQLCKIGMQVKVIEKSEERCEELCELLPDAIIINGDASDHDLLLEENVQEADAVVALTGMDEENIIMSLFAKGQGVPKVIVKVNEDRRAKMVEEFGIDSIVSVKAVTADAILRYVRARGNSRSSANIESLYQLVGGRVEALEFIVKSETEYTNIPLKELPLKANNLIACIARKRKIIIPGGNDCIQAGDSVIVITMERQTQDIRDILL